MSVRVEKKSPHEQRSHLGRVASGKWSGHSVESLKARLSEIEKMPEMRHYTHWPSPYEESFTCLGVAVRLCVVALILGGIGLTLITLSGHLLTFPQDIVALITHTAMTKWAIGAAITIVLVGGAAIIIHRARTKQDLFLEGPRGSAAHLSTKLPVVYISNQNLKGGFPAYLNTSSLNNGSGKAYLFRVKDPCEHYFLSTLIPFFATPLYLITVIAYNILRVFIAPLYVTVQYLREKCTEAKPGRHPFELYDIPKQFFKSVWNIVRAPFYALAFMFAGIYSLVKPMEGRCLAAAIERDWNDEVCLEEGYWSVNGRGKYFQFEWDKGPLGLGRNGFYLAGCWQPFGIVEFEGGEITDAYWIAECVHDTGLYHYEIQTYEELDQKMTLLLQEYAEIEAEIDYA